MAGTYVKNQVIEVDDYYDKIHRASWLRRCCGILAGGTLGAAYGGIIGSIAAFIPSAVTALGLAGATAASAAALPELGAIGLSAAILAGIGSLIGIAAVSIVGADAGAVAAGLTEKEKREKLDKLKDSGSLDPAAIPEVQINKTQDKTPKPFRWNSAIVTVPLFAAFGALISFTPAMAPMLAATPFSLAAGSNAAVAASAGIMGMFGMVFATPQSYVTNKVANFYYKVQTGQLFAGKKDQGPYAEISAQPPVQPEVSNAPELAAVSEPSQGIRRFSSETMRFSMQGLLEKTEGLTADTDVIVGR